MFSSVGADAPFPASLRLPCIALGADAPWAQHDGTSCQLTAQSLGARVHPRFPCTVRLVNSRSNLGVSHVRGCVSPSSAGLMSGPMVTPSMVPSAVASFRRYPAPSGMPRSFPALPSLLWPARVVRRRPHGPRFRKPHEPRARVQPLDCTSVPSPVPSCLGRMRPGYRGSPRLAALEAPQLDLKVWFALMVLAAHRWPPSILPVDVSAALLE